MIKIEKTEVTGWKHAIRGMRNPMNSWDKSDTIYGTYWCKIDGHKCVDDNGFTIGPNDLELMSRLCVSGTDHRKFLRMITVYLDVTAPLYWWKEFDTYKVGTVANSCSTMHKIMDHEFTLKDFSHEHLRVAAKNNLLETIEVLNAEREAYIGYGLPELKDDKQCWYSIIQLLPSSYNQKRTIMLNYEVLANIYKSRRTHKLDEWHDFCRWIESLPYSQLIRGYQLYSSDLKKEEI